MQPEPGGIINVRVGEPFEVRLKANLTAGFSWQALYDPEAISFLTRKTLSEDAAAGAASEEILRFSAKRAGSHAVTVALARPWEKSPRDSLTFTVVAEQEKRE